MTTTSPPRETETVGLGTTWIFKWSYRLADEPPGYEYGAAWGLADGFWIPMLWHEPLSGESEVDDPTEEGGMRRRAASLAAETPHVAAEPPTRPALSGNLAEDVHAICGLTWREVADVFGISERAVAGWRSQGVPRHRAQSMEALRAIGATLVGGLGPDGVREWLTAGSPSRIERLRDGEQESVAAEAQSYRDTPAT